MTCHICERDTAERVCHGCRTRLDTCLADMPHLHAFVGASLEPAASQGERVSGSANAAPLPVRLDALNLRGPAAPHAVHDPNGDQHGPPPIAAALWVWQLDWAAARGLARPHIHVDDPVGASAAFLRRHLDWACGHHPAIDDFADEITRLHRTARAIAGLTQLVHHLPAKCPDPDCDMLALVRRDGSSYVECRACGSVWSETEYRRLCIVLAAEVEQASWAS